MLKTLVAAGTLFALTAGAVAPTAGAAPLGVTSAPAIEAAITQTGGGGFKAKPWNKHPNPHPWHPKKRHRHHGHGALAAGVIGGLAVGAMLGAASQPRTCWIEERRVWRPRLGAYVIRQQHVCR